MPSDMSKKDLVRTCEEEVAYALARLKHGTKQEVKDTLEDLQGLLRANR